MKRILLTLVCCSPLLFSPSTGFSLGLIGPNGEQAVSYEQYGPISAVETLWGIATKLRPANSVSVQQTLVAIYKINPYAFYKGNINQLIPESVIKVPALEFIQAQTDQEAAALIRKYSTRKQPPKIIKQQPAAPVKEAVKEPVKPVKEQLLQQPIAQTPTPEVSAPEAENVVDKKELTALQNELDSLRNEYESITEQLLVATENNQSLKLKLQPLNDQLAAVNAQLESERVINAKLQSTVADYRTQLAAVKARPFSGDGLLNEILRWITSSLANLLIVICAPVLLLLTILAVMMRIRSQRLLAEQEQELAESTAILMEESGQFDSLLTDDFAEEPEVDFTDDESLILPDSVQTAETNTNQSDLFASEAKTQLTDEYDPFAIAELLEDDLVSSVDLDDSAVQASEDDPFAIDALLEGDLVSSVDLDDSAVQASEEDPFAIGALLEEELIANAAGDSTGLSDAQLADLDLAAEWEAQLSAQAADAQAKQVDVDGKYESSAESTIASEDKEIEAVASQEFDLSELAVDELEAIDLTSVADEEAEYIEFEIDESDLDFAEAQHSKQQVTGSGSLQESGITEAEALPASEDDLQFEVSGDVHAATESEGADSDRQDLLAKQLSDVAFNVDAPLPKVDSVQKKDFIDIDTLLEDSDDYAHEEPYSELDLDLGLDEFPDVINIEDNIDIDDDENGVAAQLDLARAYLEIDDKAGAKQILLSVVGDSDGVQRVEIDKLLSRLA